MYLRTEQKNVTTMMYLVGNFTNPGELVTDCLADTFSVFNYFLLFQKHRRLVVYISEEYFLNNSEKFWLKYTLFSY